MRDAIGLLDQLLSYGDDLLDLARVESVLGLVDAHTIGGLVDYMATGDVAAGLSRINSLVADGVELGELVDQIVAYLRGVLFVAVTRAADSLDVPQDIAEMMSRQARVLTVAFLLNTLREFIGIRALLRDQVPGVPQLPIEMAFLRSALAATGPALPAVTAVAVPSAHIAPVQLPAVELAPVAAGRLAQSAPASSVPSSPKQEKSAEGVQEGDRASGSGTDLADLARADWDHFLALAGKQCGMKVQAALRSVREVDAAGQTIVLQFSHTFARDLVNQQANRHQVEALWEEILRRRVEVRCTVAGEALTANAASPAAPAPTARTRNDEESLLSDAQRHGAVIKPIP
jgi:DNA polymerase III gamma/tau subunit